MNEEDDEMTTWTPAERARVALELGIPDEVPTFELEFQLEEEMFGRPFIAPELRPGEIDKLGAAEREAAIIAAADYAAEVYDALDYAIVPAYGPGTDVFWATGEVGPVLGLYLKRLKERFEGRRLLGFHGDGTFAIPDGNEMYDFAYQLADDYEGVLAKADRMAQQAIERNRRLAEAGIDVLLLCSDYCYNSGPFVSPAMFGDLIAPYLARICAEGRRNGQYVIKHTDGNIMPILDQLVEANPHALHSIDPMAGVDIREVKRLYGDRVALCGNVHCAAMQTGTEEEVRESAEYCLTWGKEGGSYIFCTSNVPFKGMPVDRYQLILDIWREMRAY